MNKINISKIIIVVLLILFAMFLQITTNTIPDNILTLIVSLVTMFVGISINTNHNDIDMR